MDEDTALFRVGKRRDWFEFTAGHSGCCGFYTKQNHITCPYPPLELDLLGQHSARQEETTVVLPCYRKVALRYTKFHLK